MESVREFKAWIAFITAVLTALWGWLGWLLVLLVVSMCVDYLTGTLAAGRAGTWCSDTARDGIWHKLGCVFTVVAAGLADLLFGFVISHIPTLSLAYSVLFCPMVTVWYILTELGSIAENAVKMGAPVPAFLVRALAACRGRVEGTDLTDREDTHDE